MFYTVIFVKIKLRERVFKISSRISISYNEDFYKRDILIF